MEDSLCAVCGDSSSGFHYGAYTCEGCKSFFKRTVQRNSKSSYQCTADGRCTINKSSRSRCQACRLKKCFSVGMVTQGVRGSRERGGRTFYPLREAPQESMQQQDTLSTQLDTAEAHQNDVEMTSDILDGLSSDDIMVKLVENLPVQSPPDPNLKPITEMCPMLTETETGLNVTLTKFSKGLSNELRKIVQWAKSIPGFSELSTNDKARLLSAAGMEMICFRCIYRSIPFEDALMLNEETVVARVPCYVFMSQELVDLMLHMVQRLRLLQIDVKEFACISALILVNPDAEGLSDKDKTRQLQARLLMALREHTETAHAQQTGRFAKLLLRMPTLKEVCAKGFDFYSRVQMKLEGEVPISPLTSDMFHSS